MRKISSLLLALILSISGMQAVLAAGKPASLPTPASSSKATPPGQQNKSDNSTAATSPSDQNKGSVQGNNSSNASDVAKQNANQNSAVSKSSGESSTATIDNGSTKRYIIRYSDNTILTNEITTLKNNKVKVDKTISKVFKGAVADLTDKQLAALSKNPNLAGVELDAAVSASDIQQTSSWGLDRIDQKNLPLDSTYSYLGTGVNTKIYVVDTGIRLSHQEVSGRVQAGYTAIADGNGTNDCNGHGTHVSGIASGITTGVAKAASLVPVRVLDCTGSGTTSGVIAGLDWIASVYVVGTPAVVNMSLGGGASSSLDTAVNNLISRGVTVVVAAGNSTADACLSSPSRVSGAITVAASANGDSLASYSNYGSCVDLIAPGSSIYSSWITSDSGYATLSGTSMATPFVTGVAALILSNGYQTASAVANAIKTSATPNVITGIVGSTPNLLLYSNVAASSAPTSSVPSAPTNVVAVAQKRAASLSWIAASDNGSTITSQELKIYSPGKTTVTKTVAATATSLSVSGLNSNNSYTFTLTAINANGRGLESSPSNSIKPLR